MEILPLSANAPTTPLAEAHHATLHNTAEEFEAIFLGLMLQQAGLGQARETYGGGAGEDAFSSMLADQQARALAAQGGLGLAEPIYQALLRAEGSHD